MKRVLPLFLCFSLLLSCVLTACVNPSDAEDPTSEVCSTVETVLNPDTETDDMDEATTVAVQETEPETDGTASTEPETTVEAEVQPAPEPVAYTFPGKPLQVGSQIVSAVRIVHGADASETYAAKELQKYLEKVKVKVREDGEYTMYVQIDPSLPEDGYVIEIAADMADGMTIRGGNGRGVIYGVYGFLEKYVSIYFFTPDLERCTSKDIIRLKPGTTVEYTPVFELRHTNWYTAQNAEWCVKNGINCDHTLGDDVVLTEELGGSWVYATWIHTMGWFTDGMNCLTNPRALETAISKVRGILASGQTDNVIISVSQDDGQNTICTTCENCSRLSSSDKIIYFVNAIAENIEEDYPNAVIDTLAYLYSQTPPTEAVPHPNVCVRFAPLTYCYVHAYNDPDCPVNQKLAKDIRGWSQICDRLYVWDYTTNFTYFVPTFENLCVMRDNMKFFAENGVKGMFAQGNDQSASGEFGELRAYLLAKLMMNPTMSKSEYYTHMDRFLKAYYGGGWSYIRAYIDATSGSSSLGCRDCYEDPFMSFNESRYRAWEDVFDLWWDRAEAEAGDRLAYVQRSRMQWRYIKLMLHSNREEGEAFYQDAVAYQLHWREWYYTSNVDPQTDLSMSPIHWIYLKE